jgi:hypothetical protein
MVTNLPFGFIRTCVTCLFMIAKISHFDNVVISCIVGSQIAPTYLSSCLNQGLGLLEILLLKQPIQDNRLVLKVLHFCILALPKILLLLLPNTVSEQALEICRLYELENVSTNIMKVNIVSNACTSFFIDKVSRTWRGDLHTVWILLNLYLFNQNLTSNTLYCSTDN